MTWWRRQQCRLAVAIGLGFVFSLVDVARAIDWPPVFFDPLVTDAPGISREIGVLVEHVRQTDSRLTQPSVRLQYPVLSWLQFSLEVPIAFRDRDEGPSALGSGDLLAVGQARVFAPTDWPVEIDVGLGVTLPTGDSEAVGGATTAVRPFVAAGIKLGPVDVLGSLGYQWTDGPSAHSQAVQAAIAVGRPVGWITPFVELSLLTPVGGADDHRAQVTVAPGVELYATRNLSLSLGVQLPLSSARVFDQRVLGFFRWAF
jgi:hypothetical protein